MTEVRRDAPIERGAGYAVIRVLEDGAELSQTLGDLGEHDLGGEGPTGVLQRQDPNEPEPFLEGTRYIVVPGDHRGVVQTVGSAVVFVISGLAFAFTTPAIGFVLFFFVGLAVIVVSTTFFRLEVLPILIDMRAPQEESGFWNEELEGGKVLLFASSEEKKSLRPVWEIMQERSIHFDVIDERLVSRPVNAAVLYVAGSGGRFFGAARYAPNLQCGARGAH